MLLKNFISLLGMAILFHALSLRAEPLIGSLKVSDCAKSEETLEDLRKESAEILKRSKETAKLYQLNPGETLKDITQEVLAHTNTSDAVKAAISEKQRKYYVFSYPSDNLQVKGYISLPTDTQSAPLIILLRGGNQLFGLPHPRELSIQPGYAMVCPLLRGGVSEGKDEYGGKDVNDVKNMMDYLPILEQQLKFQFHPQKKYMIGVSRGGMQLFLALGRYPQLQKQISKVASISGLLNLEFAIKERTDFKEALQDNFGYTEDVQGKAWIAHRQPTHYVNKIAKNLPILIAQGTSDNRVCLKEGYDMLQALRDSGHTVSYVEIEGGDHVLANSPDFMPLLMKWLEKE